MQAQARRAGVHLSFEDGFGPVELSLDGSRMERAIGNLVRNALEHTPLDGHVDVSVRAEEGLVSLRVRDSGEGIAPEDMPNIWTRFYRAEKSRTRTDGAADGAGLGLAIARGIIESHGGTIAVESERGRGSEFIVRFPRS